MDSCDLRKDIKKTWKYFHNWGFFLVVSLLVFPAESTSESVNHSANDTIVQEFESANQRAAGVSFHKVPAVVGFSF